jgi:hypothetical protein
MFNWLRKRLGYHVCEEFTQWEVKRQKFEGCIINTFTGDVVVESVVREKRWQERRCMLCGRLFTETISDTNPLRSPE